MMVMRSQQKGKVEYGDEKIQYGSNYHDKEERKECNCLLKEKFSESKYSNSHSLTRRRRKRERTRSQQ